MNTFTDEDLTILESLEFEPACEKSNHRPEDEDPATWAVLFLPQHACGCPTPGVALWCEPCRARFVRARRIHCVYCGAVNSASEHAVLRIEPLR